MSKIYFQYVTHKHVAMCGRLHSLYAHINEHRCTFHGLFMYDAVILVCMYFFVQSISLQGSTV